MQMQKERSRNDAAKVSSDWVVLDSENQSVFVGYNSTECEVSILKYRKQVIKNKDVYQLVFDKTPFYAESGGQVGDKGFIEFEYQKIYITDTQKENSLIVHTTEALPIRLDASFSAVVDVNRRQRITNNHSATHLLHKALREVLGSHVEQKGSLVSEHSLRFDFSHFQKLSDDEVKRVEQIVNQAIRANEACQLFNNMSMNQAQQMGAMALFGEKYGDHVRVVKFGDSVELCGGTHVNATGQIGQFIIRQETSIAAGIRRIEAITADTAEQYLIDQRALLDELRSLLKNPADLPKAIEQIMTQNKDLQRKLDQFQQVALQQQKFSLLDHTVKVGEVQLIANQLDMDVESLKRICQQIVAENANMVVLLASIQDGKPSICVGVSKDLIEIKKLNAGNIIRELAKEIDGGGGGQAHLAAAGGKNPAGVPAVLARIKELI
jgi:alanyl-tRNA synthetase